ncbi:MAG: hypothetical protein IKU55_03985, partial [Clostridia bacterium]|nr:hypothetical protein [Clostridia bacterium]
QRGVEIFDVKIIMGEGVLHTNHPFGCIGTNTSRRAVRCGLGEGLISLYPIQMRLSTGKGSLFGVKCLTLVENMV